MKTEINKSGIMPAGNRVVVMPDEIEETSEGGIIIAPSIKDRHQHAQSIGTLIAVGPDAWRHTTKTVERLIDGQWKPVERIITGYQGAFAEVGDRVSFAQYTGLQVEGEDGKIYRIINDEDITCCVTEGVSFNDIKSRKRLGAA